MEYARKILGKFYEKLLQNFLKCSINNSENYIIYNIQRRFLWKRL